MNREQKEAVVQSLKEDFTSKPASFLVGYKGLTVAQMQNLRNELRQKGGTFKVAKARLMKRAADGVEGADTLISFFKEQVALVFADQEPPAVAKVLKDFSKQHDALQLVAGVFEQKLLDKEAIMRIALLPSREVLLGQICGSLKAPISGLVRVLNTLLMKPLWALKQIEAQKK